MNIDFSLIFDTPTSNLPVISTQSLNLSEILSTSLITCTACYPKFSLNEFQKQNYNNIINRNDNYIFKAPTGTGKTFLQDLAISQFQQQGKIIIVILPTNSLLLERYNQHLKYFPAVNACILNGQSQIENFNLNVIYTNTEKADELLKRKKYLYLQNKINLIIIDEIHYIQTDRSRFYWFIIDFCLQFNIRFLGFSATIENNLICPEHVKFIQFNTENRVKYKFEQIMTQNIIDLSKIHIGIAFKQLKDNISSIFTSITKNYIGYIEKQSDLYLANKQIIIFCPTQKLAEQTASYFSLQMKNQYTTAIQIENKELSLLVNNQVGYHHSSLSSQDKFSVEQMFLQKQIKILASTSTLQVGVNLNADLVVIYTSVLISNGDLQRQNLSSILQMAGRSGRQHTQQGYCLFLDDSNMQNIKQQVIDSLFTTNTKENDQRNILDFDYMLTLFSQNLGTQLQFEQIEQKICNSAQYNNKQLDFKLITQQFIKEIENITVVTESGILFITEIDSLFQYHIKLQALNNILQSIQNTQDCQFILATIINHLNFSLPPFNQKIEVFSNIFTQSILSVYKQIQEHSKTNYIQQCCSTINRLCSCACNFISNYEDIKKLLVIQSLIGSQENSSFFNFTFNDSILRCVMKKISNNAKFKIIIQFKTQIVLVHYLDPLIYLQGQQSIILQNREKISFFQIKQIYILNLEDSSNFFEVNLQTSDKEIQTITNFIIEPQQKLGIEKCTQSVL